MEESREKFSEFVSLCRSVTDGDYEVIKLLQKRFNKCRPEFIASEAFRTKVTCTMQKIQGDPSNKFVHIKTFVTTLKANEEVNDCSTKKRTLEISESSDMDSLPDIKRPRRIVEQEEKIRRAQQSGSTEKQNETSAVEKKRKRLTTQLLKPSEKTASRRKSDRKKKGLMVVVSSLHEKNEDKEIMGANNLVRCESEEPGSVKSASDSEEQERTTTPVSALEGSETKETSPVHRESSNSSAVKGSHRQIRKLEALLQEIRNEIESLEEKELTLEDLDDDENNYILMDKYKKKFVQVWNKLCGIKGRESSTGRSVERRFRFNGSRYPEINRKVEKFVNKFREFPDFQDIRDIVIRSNNKFKLKFNKKKVDSLARDIFTDVGNQLQQRRQEDFASNFGSSVTDHVRMCEDPALFDRKLKAKLDSNKQIGKTKLEKVLRKFADKQEDGESSSEEEEAENSMEEEEEKVKVLKACSSPYKKQRQHAVADAEDMTEYSCITHNDNTKDNSCEGGGSHSNNHHNNNRKASNEAPTIDSSGVDVLTEDEGVGVELKKFLLTNKVKEINREVLTKILNEDKSSLKSPYRRKQKFSRDSPKKAKDYTVEVSVSESSDDEEIKTFECNGTASKEYTRSPSVTLVDCLKSPSKYSPLTIVDLTTPVKVTMTESNIPRSPLVRLKKLDIQSSPVKLTSLPAELLGAGKPARKKPRRLSLKRLASSSSRSGIIEEKNCEDTDKPTLELDNKDSKTLSEAAATGLLEPDVDSMTFCDQEKHKLLLKENMDIKGIKKITAEDGKVSEAVTNDKDDDKLQITKDFDNDHDSKAVVESLESASETIEDKELVEEKTMTKSAESCSQELDKVEVYIDRACDDNYIEIFSDEESGNHHSNQKAATGKSDQKQETCDKISDGRSNSECNKDSSSKTTVQSSINSLSAKIVGSNAADVSSEKGIAEGDDRRTDKIELPVGQKRKNKSDIEDLPDSQPYVIQSDPEDASEIAENIDDNDEPVSSLEIVGSNPNHSPAGQRASENVVSSTNYAEQEDLVSNSVDEKTTVEKAAEEEKQDEVVVSSMELHDSVEEVMEVDDADERTAAVSTEKAAKQESEDENGAVTNIELDDSIEELKEVEADRIDADAEVDTSEKVEVGEADGTQENVQIIEDSLIVDKVDDKANEGEKITESEETTVANVGLNLEDKEGEQADKSCKLVKNSNGGDNEDDNSKEMVDAGKNKVDNAEIIDQGIEKVITENTSGSKRLEEKQSDPPESTSTDLCQQETGKQVQEDEVSESNQTVEDLDSFAKNLLQQAMDKLKEPIIGALSGETCDSNSEKSAKDTGGSASTSSNSSKVKVKEKKKKSDRAEEHRSKKSHSDGKEVSSIKHKKKQDQTSRHCSIDNNSRKTFTMPDQTVIDLTGVKSPTHSKPRHLGKVHIRHGVKYTSGQSKCKPFEPQRGSHLKRRGSANSPIVLSDTSGSATPARNISTNSSKQQRNLPSKVVIVSGTRVVTPANNNKTVTTSYNKQLPPPPTSKSNVILKTLSKNQLASRLPYDPPAKVKSNYMDIIKSVTTKVFSGGAPNTNSNSVQPGKHKPVSSSSLPSGGSSSSSRYVNPMLNFASIKPCATSTPKQQLCRSIGGPSTQGQNQSSVKVVKVCAQSDRGVALLSKNSKTSSSTAATMTKASNEDGVAEPSSTQDLSGDDVVGSSGQPPEMGDVILLDD